MRCKRWPVSNSTRPGVFTLALTLSLCLVGIATAAEVHSNGTGGGLWSDAATWRKKAVPAPDDSVVISAGDTVEFDRDDSDKQTCKELYIDPSGALTYNGGGKRVFVVGGPVESYGTIKIDASQSNDLMEFRLAADKQDKLTLTLLKGGSLLMYGKPGGEGKNAALVCKPSVAALAGSQGIVLAGSGTMVDLQRAAVADIKLNASSIDNTGAKPNEKISIADCLFTGQGTIYLYSCDTPSVLNNLFAYSGEATLGFPAITVYGSPLADVRGNHINGKYSTGINGSAQNESAVVNNTIEKCGYGIYWYGTNGMLKGNTLKNCDIGIIVTSMTGVIEDSLIDGSKTAVNISGATVQINNLTVTNLQKDGIPIDMPGGVLTLMNCDIKPEQIKLAGTPPKEGPWVLAMNYVVVGVKNLNGRKPMVELKTTTPEKPIAPGALDPNVRNSPAPLGPRDITPLPSSNMPLTVRAWTIGADKKPTAAPAYTLSVFLPLPPDAKPEDKPTVLATQSITPQANWYRAKADDPTPTVEVTLP